VSVEKKETEVSALLALLGALFLITGAGLSLLWYHRVA
jgi:Ca-activated chloride channel family protein